MYAPNIDREFERNRGFNPAFIVTAKEIQKARAIEAHRLMEESRARELLKARKAPPWVRDIVLEISAKHCVSPAAVITESRTHPVTKARWEIIHLIKAKKPMLSAPQMGRWLGRNHTSILFALARYAELYGGPVMTGYDLVRKRARRAERLQAASLDKRGPGNE